jgi:hypothetical protein
MVSLFWVELLLSLAWSGLGSIMLLLFIPCCHPVMVFVFPVSVENRDLGWQEWNCVQWILTVQDHVRWMLETRGSPPDLRTGSWSDHPCTFGVPICGADWVESLGIRLVENEWVKEWTLLRTTWHKRATLCGNLDYWHLCWNLSGYASASENHWTPYSDVLASHRRKCECSWPAWQNGDVSLMEIGDEITSYGECVQPLQSVKLLW